MLVVVQKAKPTSTNTDAAFLGLTRVLVKGSQLKNKLAISRALEQPKALADPPDSGAVPCSGISKFSTMIGAVVGRPAAGRAPAIPFLGAKARWSAGNMRTLSLRKMRFMSLPAAAGFFRLVMIGFALRSDTHLCCGLGCSQAASVRGFAVWTHLAGSVVTCAKRRWAQARERGSERVSVSERGARVGKGRWVGE